MNEDTVLAHGRALEQITDLEDRPLEDLAPNNGAHARAVLRSWREVLLGAEGEARRPVDIALLAQVGRGKSTLVAAASSLVLGSTARSPRKWAVLRVAPGRTTLGEWHVRFEDREDIEVSVEEWWTHEELERELQLYAEDIWDQVFPSINDANPAGTAGEELKRLLNTWTDAGGPSQEKHKARARELAAQAAEREESADHARAEFVVGMRSRAGLEARGTGASWTTGTSPEELVALQTRLTEINEGTCADLLAPRQTVLRLPAAMGPGAVGSLIDTQGLEANSRGILFTGRQDIQSKLDQPSLPIVVCSNFEEAPDLGSLTLLKLLLRPDEGLDGLRPVRDRLALVLIDKGNSEDDDEDPEQRQMDRTRKVAECKARLRSELRDRAEAVDVLVVDARVPDDVELLKKQLESIARAESSARWERWDGLIRGAQQALAPLLNHLVAERLRYVDLQLFWRWEAGLAQRRSEAVHPLVVLADAIRGRDSRDYEHWSHLNAAARRDGVYSRLDLPALAARLWVGQQLPRPAFLDLLRSPRVAVRESWFASQDDLARAHVAMRVEQFHRLWLTETERARTTIARDLREWFKSPEAAPVWTRLRARWGEGPGYVDDYADLMAQSARLCPSLAHPASPLPDVSAVLGSDTRHLLLQRVRLQGFRLFEDLTLEPGALTVLVGDNGHGKTSVLTAMAHLLSPLVVGFTGGEPSPLNIFDPHRDSFSNIREGAVARAPTQPLHIEAMMHFEGTALLWARDAEVVGSHEREQLHERQSGDTVTRRTHTILEELQRPTDRKLPLFAAYFRERTDASFAELDPDRIVDNYRLDGYRACLRSGIDHTLFLHWMRKQTYAAVQRGRTNRLLKGIERAVSICVPDVARFSYEIQNERLEVVWSNGASAPFATMSDGYRTMISLIADLAWRACVLNPQLVEFAPELTEGVVLIDEVDLHLHPKWQRRVLSDLRRAFPRLQLIVSTHSPQVIASADPTWIRVLRAGDEVGSVEHSLGVDSNTLLREVFDDGGYPRETVERIGEIRARIAEGDLAGASTLVDTLERNLGDMADTVRTLRWELAEASLGEE
jgi:predicted ATP-binding protein involved in virulence